MKKKEFTTTVDNKEIKLFVVKPNLEQENEASKVFTKTKIRLLNLPKEERPFAQAGVRVKLKDAGVWSDEQEERLAEISEKLAKLEEVLKTGERVEDDIPVKLTKKEGREVALEVMVLRYTQFALLEEVEAFARDITLEKIAEKEQVDYLVSVCTLDENNKKYFKGLEDYKSRRYDQDAVDARTNLMNHMAELTKDWREDLIEYKFLRKYNFMNDEYQLIDSKGRLCDSEFKLVDKDGNYIDEEGNIIKEAPSEVGNFLD